MSRLLRKYRLHEETGIVFQAFRNLRQGGPNHTTTPNFPPGGPPGGFPPGIPPGAPPSGDNPNPSPPGSTPSYDTVWLDRNDHTIWLVNFDAVPATVTQTTGNNIDGWILNGGYFIFIDTHQLRVSNNAGLLTPRFRNVPSTVLLPLSVSLVTGELLHG